MLRGGGTRPKSHPLVTELGLESPVLGCVSVWGGGDGQWERRMFPGMWSPNLELRRCNVGMRTAKIVFIDPGESLRKTGL